MANSAVAELPFPEPQLSDETVRLRPWAHHDVDAVYEATQDPLIIPRFTRVPENQSQEDVRRFIESREPERQAGRVLPLVIASADSDDLLGSISLMGVEWEQRRAAIGFWLAPWARGQGAATRALRLLSRWALLELGVARLEIGTYIDNHASQRVAKRCGFVREGALRSFLEVRGDRHDIVMFSLLPTDL